MTSIVGNVMYYPLVMLMRIAEFEWDQANILHLALGHGIEPEEAEEIFAISPVIRKTKRGHYAAFGRTIAGRLLIVVFENMGKCTARVITGWDMDNAERRFYMTTKKGGSIRKRESMIRETAAEYYSKHGILSEIQSTAVEFSLNEELREQILKGKRLWRLQNISIKLDPAQIIALKKLATMKSIPYQTLIRQWLAEGIRKELRIAAK